MANKIYRNIGTNKVTPQSQPIPGREEEMVKNNAGGFVFDAGMWTMLERFLVLGTEGGTMYLGEKQHTMTNFKNVEACIDQDYRRTVDMVVDVSFNGRAMKQDQAIFVLALVASSYDVNARRYALSKLNTVCRTASHLQMFVDFINERRSWGRALRNAISNWYESKGLSNAAFQMAKYQERNGWSHSDILRSAHPAPKTKEFGALFKWAVGNGYNADSLAGTMIEALELMKTATNVNQVIDIIKKFNAPWEIVPTNFRTEPDVWEAMLPSMGLTAMIRNFGNMTRYGVFNKKANVEIAVNRLSDGNVIQKARLHPLNVLVGSLTYQQGHGVKSDNTWGPHRDISYAFEGAFYKSFKYAPSTGKRIMYALDLSGSMWWAKTLNGLLTPAEVSAVLSMALLEAEPGSEAYGFDTSLYDLGKIIHPGVKLVDVVNKMAKVGGGGTDCSRPMIWAKDNHKQFDAFVMLTDNETWAGRIHPVQALRNYRNASGIKDAKMCVVAMMSTGFTIADPKDPGMLDVVGCTADLPMVIQNFIGRKGGSADTEDEG